MQGFELPARAVADPESESVLAVAVGVDTVGDHDGVAALDDRGEGLSQSDRIAVRTVRQTPRSDHDHIRLDQRQ